MRLSLIVAVADNGVIGRENDLPWHLPRDLRRFRRLTMGHHLIMGRRTFEAVGRPLPGRKTLVLSRDRSPLAAGVEVVATLHQALALARSAGDDEAFVAGGAEVYRLALPLADRIYQTRVHDIVDGDCTFPDIEPGDWLEREREHFPVSADNAIPITFLVLDRQRSAPARK